MKLVQALLLVLALAPGCGQSGGLGVDAGPRETGADGPAATGGSWTTFAKLGGRGLRKIWGSSDSDIWVVGLYAFGSTVLDGPTVSSPGRIVHFDGTSWRDLDAAGATVPWDIWGAAANDFWITGGTLRHFDGAGFTDVVTPTGTTGVWGVSANDVWFGTGTGVLHWDGAALTAVPSPRIDGILSIWGFSSSDVWAGGGNPGLMHWNGSAWSLVATGNTLYVYGLWGSGPTDLWGVGNGGNRLHWDGASLVGTSEDYTSFEAISGTSADDVWGVGECCWDSGADGGWMSHYDGVGWTDLRLPDLGSLTGIWTSPSGRSYAIAGGNTVLRLGPGGETDGGVDGGTDGGAAACTTATTELRAQLTTFQTGLQADGGPCATILDCEIYVPVVDCGPDYRVTGCPTIIASAGDDAVRAQTAALAASACGAVPTDASCRTQDYLDCALPWPVCKAGRCMSDAPR